jgi:LysM repeat protein
MHTMLHPRGQHAGAGVAQSSSQVYVILDVAAYWGDAGLTPQPVNAAYGLNAATQIAISQYIAPVVKAKPAADGSITHVVQSGQSLWMLAHHYGVTIDRLRELNGLGTSDMIYVGQKILIQLPSPATPTVVSDRTTLLPTQTMGTTQTPVLYFTQYATEMQREASTPKADSSGWYVLFFTLFGLGLILVVVGMTGRRA